MDSHQDEVLSFPLDIVSKLPGDLGYIPISVEIDFGAKIAEVKDNPPPLELPPQPKLRRTGRRVDGLETKDDRSRRSRLDPNSIQVLDLATGESVAFGRSDDFSYGDRGRLEWVIQDSSHNSFEIRFRAVESRPALEPQSYVPMVGVGDLLRYNAGETRPMVLSKPTRLVDLTGNGKPDLAGCWNYYYRPGDPISGVVCFPRQGSKDEFMFGDMARLRYVEERGSKELHHFPGVYVEADFADLNGDGLPDIVFADMRDEAVTVYLNTGDRDDGGLPIFVKDVEIPAPVSQNAGICVVDLDGDGVLDLVVNGHFIRNLNSNGWPFEPSDPVDLKTGKRLSFIDLTGDGRPDALSMPVGGYDQRLVWHRNKGKDPIEFNPGEPLAGIDLEYCSLVCAMTDGDRPGVLVQHNMYQNLSFFELVGHNSGKPEFTCLGRAESMSAVMSFSDQAWPCKCDWNGDGVYDLVIGGGYGWPRVVINEGTNERPAWGEPKLILSEGEPIRIRRDEILFSEHWHNMGYPYPVFVDWDGDGLPDLLLPNETNRILWFRNVGTLDAPKFGPRQFLEVEGYPDSETFRRETGEKTMGPDMPTNPFDEHSPFYYRCGIALADWNADGLMDFIAFDNFSKATLFVQYRDASGKLRLKREGRVKLVDDREIDDSIVGRTKHWTESFRAVDWDGNGLTDLVYSLAATGKIYLLRNVGTGEEPLFDVPREFKYYGEEMGFTIHGPNAWAGDFNGDGKPDLLGCVEWSVYPFFAHAALEMDTHPEYLIGKARPC
mgnify:CR=1 FL=1|tara:strand:- start:5040 stop:7361 length:2322 start_codon:yes stop_codon:yes gene_type:complete